MCYDGITGCTGLFETGLQDVDDCLRQDYPPTHFVLRKGRQDNPTSLRIIGVSKNKQDVQDKAVDFQKEAVSKKTRVILIRPHPESSGAGSGSLCCHGGIFSQKTRKKFQDPRIVVSTQYITWFLVSCFLISRCTDAMHHFFISIQLYNDAMHRVVTLNSLLYIFQSLTKYFHCRLYFAFLFMFTIVLFALNYGETRNYKEYFK